MTQPIPHPASQNRPNILLIVADDLGYGDVGLYGSPDALTPNIDAIGQKGTWFKQFYAEAPACTPTRFALLTGLHANRSRQPQQAPPYLLYPLRPMDTAIGLASGTPTLATVLKAKGYKTALFGKWHLGHGAMLGEGDRSGNAQDSPFHPNYHGFDEFYGPLFGVIDYNTHYTGAPGQRQLDWFDNKTLLPEEEGQYATQLLTQKAVKYISNQAGQSENNAPFFLYLAYTAPHWGFPTRVSPDPSLLPLARTQLPLDPETEHAYLAPFANLNPRWYPGFDLQVRQRYLAMVAILDDGVGEVIRSLRQYQLERETIVLFISDNGGDILFGGSNGLLRGQKFEMYEGGIRVPALIQWPGQIPSNWTSEQIAHVMDLLPTLLGLTGTSDLLPSTLDGLDFSAHLQGGRVIDRDLCLSNPFFGEVYRRGPWKYVRNRLQGNAPELYHLEVDLREENNVAWFYPQKSAELEAAHAQVRLMKGFTEEDKDEALARMVNDRLTTILKEKGFPHPA